MNEIARKLDFSLRRLVSALIIIYFFAAPFASTYASGAVTEVFQEGKKAATRKLTGKIIDKNTKETLINPEKPDVPLNKNDAFQKVQKRRVQEKR